jgi:short subunit dehydrogenase-like uncharacterized protein
MNTDVVVYGATGLVGRRVCADLDRGGVAFAIAGRRADAIDALGRELPSADKLIATLGEPEALVRAFSGAKVVVNCAGPLAAVGEPIVVAALAAGAHYVDLGGDQAFVHALFERHDSSARRAGRVVVPGCAVDGLLGDLAAAWAARHVCGITDDGDTVRTGPVMRLAEDRPLDEVCVSYIFDDLVLSPGSQKTLFGTLGARSLAWKRDRWEPAGATRRRVNAGPQLGGERTAVGFGGGDVITIPRHVAARSVQAFVSTTRNAAAATAMRLVARALPLVPKKASELLAPYTPPEDHYARTQFAVVAQARRSFAAAQVVVRGRDIYQTSGSIAAWVARALVSRPGGPVGMRAPAELFRPAPALQEIATAAGLSIEPSFGVLSTNV